jgi:hypothetical protein
VDNNPSLAQIVGQTQLLRGCLGRKCRRAGAAHPNRVDIVVDYGGYNVAVLLDRIVRMFRRIFMRMTVVTVTVGMPVTGNADMKMRLRVVLDGLF